MPLSMQPSSSLGTSRASSAARGALPAPCPRADRHHVARPTRARRSLRCTANSAAAPREPLPEVRSTLLPDELLQLLRNQRAGEERSGPGEVYLVGTGPGDPGLLTLHALRCMQTADVVLYDRLVSDDILRLVHGGARMVYVGKQAGFHTRSQEQIHELLCEFASAGHKVLRLKGGDPYVFGRGGEEMLHLQQRGIKVHCIPGITAASGICADIGVPLTHRGLATSVKFLTGHSRDGGKEQLDECIDSGVDAHTTLVIYMGLNTLPEVSRRLVAAGLGADTPAVAVERGTLPEQRAAFAPLQGLHAAVQRHALQSPTLIVIGDVVRLAPGWRALVEHGDGSAVPSAGQYMHLQAPWQLQEAREALDGSVTGLTPLL